MYQRHACFGKSRWFTTKLLGDRPRPQAFGFHLINLLVGSVALKFHRHFCKDECVNILEGAAVTRIGPDLYRVEAKILLAVWLVMRRMIYATPTHHVYFV